MGHDTTHIDSIFGDDSFFKENIDGFTIRFDYFSKPDYLALALSAFDLYFKSYFGHHIDSDFEFSHREPNGYERMVINVDAVSEALHTRIEEVARPLIYVYEDLGRALSSLLNSHIHYNANLIVGPYYLLIHIADSPISSDILPFVEGVYDVVKSMHQEKKISLCNLNLTLTGKELFDNKHYEEGEAYGKYTTLVQKRIPVMQDFKYKFDIDGIGLLISNSLRYSDVEIDNKTYYNIWDHRITCIASYGCHKGLPENLEAYIREIVGINQKYVEICVG